MEMMRALAIVLAVAAIARAEPRKIDDAKKAEAIAHFRQGEEYFKSSQWEAAIKEYQAAFELTGEPLMIFDIALASEKAGKLEPAYDGYERYLHEVSLGSAADDARAGKARLQRAVDKIRADRTAREQAEAEVAAEAKRREDERRTAARTRAEAEARPHDARARTYTVAAIGVVGAGAIAIGVGIKYGLDALAAADDVSKYTAGWTDAELARDREGHAANTKMIVFTGIGAAAVATGGVLYLLARREHGRADEIRLAVTPGGVSVAGRF